MDNPEKAEQSAQKFKDEGFPGKVPWGCLDGTHVLVSPPKDTPQPYFNRHETKSLNVLLLVNAFGIFGFCSSNNPGSMHDSAIFGMSRLKRKLQKLFERHLPFIDAAIFADSAFKRNLPYLATPS